jgi:sulfonate dioxygenase
MNRRGKYLRTLDSALYLPIDSFSYPPLTPFEHRDPGLDADTSLKDLLPEGQAQVKQITPNIGSEVRGVQLSSLAEEGKQQLALFVAQRKVVGMEPLSRYSMLRQS